MFPEYVRLATLKVATSCYGHQRLPAWNKICWACDVQPVSPWYMTLICLLLTMNSFWTIFSVYAWSYRTLVLGMGTSRTKESCPLKIKVHTVMNVSPVIHIYHIQYLLLLYHKCNSLSHSHPSTIHTFYLLLCIVPICNSCSLSANKPFAMFIIAMWWFIRKP